MTQRKEVKSPACTLRDETEDKLTRTLEPMGCPSGSVVIRGREQGLRSCAGWEVSD